MSAPATNELDVPSQAVSLSGSWQFRFGATDRGAWQTIDVPGCWEQLDLPKGEPGPGWYRRRFTVPAAWQGRRLWLAFDGVSYQCQVAVDGHVVGSHTGSWDRFRLDITAAVSPGAEAELVVEVTKPVPAGVGPDAGIVATAPGVPALRETLSGFLPYVWGNLFGGLWQEVRLEATGEVVIDDLFARGDAHGRLRVDCRLSAPAAVALTLVDAEGRTVAAHESASGRTVRWRTRLAEPRLWSPSQPALYQLVARVAGHEQRAAVGFRSFRGRGSALQLNGQPCYPRLALSWGWYPDALHSNPDPAAVERDFEQVRAAGCNGVKLCLWVPPRWYLELADRMGMLLWMELPLWLPEPTPYFLRQTPQELATIVRQVRGHPSVCLYTLGCELSRSVEPNWLGTQYRRVKRLTGGALVRDNSGSAEAYGGARREHADFADHHLYAELQYLEPLLQHFAPGWRSEQPWLMGEFCDKDTFRELGRLHRARGGEQEPAPAALLWWTQADPRRNPQGVRWQYDVVEQEQRLRVAQLTDRQQELEAVSRHEALLHRQYTLQAVRTVPALSGYVITGERDTPISTAGLLDDLGAPKHAPATLRASNHDLVLALGWDRARQWAAGGDRAAYADRHCYRAGAAVRWHVVLANHSTAAGAVDVEWQLVAGDRRLRGSAVPAGATTGPGRVSEVLLIETEAPATQTPLAAELRVSARVAARGSGGTAGERHNASDERVVTNRWPVWFFPDSTPTDGVQADGPRCLLHDPSRALGDPEPVATALQAAQFVPGGTDSAAPPLLATAWTAAVAGFVAAGGSAIVSHHARPAAWGTLDAADAPPWTLLPRPFWREGVKLLEQHPAWGDFPHQGWADLQFFGMAPDLALGFPAAPPAGMQPLMRRLDARTMELLDYAVALPWRRGRLIVTTLRLGGGLGTQPTGLSANVAALHLVRCWLRHLSTAAPVTCGG